MRTFRQSAARSDLAQTNPTVANSSAVRGPAKMAQVIATTISPETLPNFVRASALSRTHGES